jgi:hypothetical protein
LANVVAQALLKTAMVIRVRAANYLAFINWYQTWLRAYESTLWITV